MRREEGPQANLSQRFGASGHSFANQRHRAVADSSISGYGGATLAIGAAATVLLALAAIAARSSMLAGAGTPDQAVGGPYEFLASWPLPPRDRAFDPAIEPLDVALGPGDRLYVADGRNNVVVVYNREGQRVAVWDDRPAVPFCGGTATLVPNAIAVDRTRVYILWNLYRFGGNGPAPESGYIQIRLGDGTVLSTVRSPVPGVDIAPAKSGGYVYLNLGSGIARLLINEQQVVFSDVIFMQNNRVAAGSLATTQDGRLAVVKGSGTVYFYSPEGKELGQLTLDRNVAVSVADDAQGQLHVLVRPPRPNDPQAPLLLTFSASGTLIASRSADDLGTVALPPSNWPFVLDVAGNELASSTAQDRFEVRWLTIDGAMRSTVSGGPLLGSVSPRPLPSTAHVCLGTALSLAPAAGNGIIAFDGGQAQLVRFSSDGIASVIGPLLSQAKDATNDSVGNVYVSTADDRLMRFAADDLATPVWDVPCRCDLGGRVALGNSLVYVSRPRTKRVAVFDAASGNEVRELGLDEVVGLWPADLVMARGGRLFTGAIVII